MARVGSVVARDFIWVRISRSWLGGRVFRVREMASVQVTPGGISFPGGRGGRLADCQPDADAAALPFDGWWCEAEPALRGWLAWGE